MPTPIYVVDAFADAPFTGNPAGVCVLASSAGEPWMQSVAAEMRHAETAFVVPNGRGFGLRWFTPKVEIDLCGHATLASAHVLWETGRLPAGESARFETKSGTLECRRDGDEIAMDFPALAVEPVELGASPASLGLPEPVFVGRSTAVWFLELPSETDVRGHEPDFGAIAALGLRGLIITAAGTSGADFVSRFFAPNAGVPEDPVTGSAHCALAPYWAAKLGRPRLRGFQASERTGWVTVEARGDRVGLIGRARTVLAGELVIEPFA